MRRSATTHSQRRALPTRVAIATLALALATAAVPGTARGEDALYQDNLVVIVDASGSMAKPMPGARQNKMEVAKTALLEVLGNVPRTTNVGVLVFSGRDASGRPIREGWIQPLGPLEPEKLGKAVRGLQPDGKTPLGRYLAMGSDRLLEQRRAQKNYGTYRLLVVTDGEATDGALVERHLPDILSRGITVDVIGVDMQRQHSLATRVHSYRSANDPKALRSAISEVLAEIGSQDPAATSEAFELLDGFPDAVAVAVITTLGRAHNEPIGEKARSAPEAVMPTGTAPGTSRPPAARASQPQQPQQYQPPPDRTGLPLVAVLAGLVGGAILLAVAGVVLAAITRGRRR